MEKAYNPGEIESRWYKKWLQSGCFEAPKGEASNSFCIVIPPPNVTGVLTMGHVLNNTLQDVLIRRARQSGKAALWLPGTDHAGIATQTRVERELRTQGKTRHDLGREAFIQRACEWRSKHGGIIIEQLKRLGASCDWARSIYTLDGDYSRAVLTVFVELYKRGRIYRGNRMVNWCPVSLTALSDEEVIMQKQMSTLYKVRYELAERPGEWVAVCTTRPETIMGDVAVAVHPSDERYKHLVGLHAWRPLSRERIPIIADKAVLMDFGTGALKITPAHDMLDWEIGQRHQLPALSIMNEDGTMSEAAGPDFAGMERFAARKAAVEKLRELGLLIEEIPYENSVGFSERASVPVEPRLSQQWFLKYPRVEEAKEVVSEGLIKFIPERWTKTYLHWLGGIQDWCISRQLWWGHRIPVWYRKGADRLDPRNQHVSVEGPVDPENWEQDADVLDTWFSAWLWPFATLGWPDKQAMAERGFNKWYPTSDLVTGPDIIFFWVARMVMAGLEFTGNGETGRLSAEEIRRRLPFRTVYFTGIIRDAQGRKMSKSLGNSPDPIELIEKYGADALRFGILSMAAQGQDVFFHESGIEQGRSFCTKLWNACRYRLLQDGQERVDRSNLQVLMARIAACELDSIDKALLHDLSAVTLSVHKALDTYEFNQAAKALNSFFWSDYCDWYVEVTKHRTGQGLQAALAIQDLILRQFILLAHPFMPFITEELWHAMGFAQEDEFIQNVPPLPEHQFCHRFPYSEISTQATTDLRAFISLARSLKAQLGLSARKDVTLHLRPAQHAAQTIAQHAALLRGLIGYSELTLGDALEKAPAVITALGTLYLKLSESGIDLSAEKARIAKEIEKLERGIAAGESKLASEEFRARAPAHILEGARKELEQTKLKHLELSQLMKQL